MVNSPLEKKKKGKKNCIVQVRGVRNGGESFEIVYLGFIFPFHKNSRVDF